jgi:protein-disulfide isomerase
VVGPEIVQRYVEPGRVRIVWRDFAWIGEESRLAAQAARCAGQQSRFWDYHDLLFARQRGYNNGTFARPNLQGFAAELGLDTAAFNTCLERGEDLPQIQQELTAARQAGITATPTFVVGGRRLAGAQGLNQLAAALDAELARLGQ